MNRDHFSICLIIFEMVRIIFVVIYTFIMLRMKYYTFIIANVKINSSYMKGNLNENEKLRVNINYLAHF